MPRVSQEHSDRRRQQILAAARRCFVREGFHQTSMTDIFAEAGLSAGAVYGHFGGKGEIITVIAEEVTGEVDRLVESIFTREPPLGLADAMRQGLEAASGFAFGEQGFARLAPQVWAEALRDDELLEMLRGRYSRIQGMISHLVAAEQRAGRVAAGADPDEVAKVLFGVIMGYILQGLFVGNVEASLYAGGLDALRGSP
ncbi:TetR/AcrR family transcriptional regulator [Phytoactinopolyspora mesophila]|uniref:TetR family transcriptional regulator n=1 Tax=Phytoactinopolyspora mesophila TaxID=2650750 RepID=A0A7K3MC92_9ACTN|nr:TetR/AcrR family transcriptional regulator [Phytoactinopolyspora mesophila]NDL60582.1 TetR family transcriptional regulator [Phytoactinopolyspora mesophila]